MSWVTPRLLIVDYWKGIFSIQISSPSYNRNKNDLANVMRKSFDGFLVSDDTMFSSNPIAVNRIANQIRRKKKNYRLFLLI